MAGYSDLLHTLLHTLPDFRFWVNLRFFKYLKISVVAPAGIPACVTQSGREPASSVRKRLKDPLRYWEGSLIDGGEGSQNAVGLHVGTSAQLR